MMIYFTPNIFQYLCVTVHFISFQSLFLAVDMKIQFHSLLLKYYMHAIITTSIMSVKKTKYYL